MVSPFSLLRHSCVPPRLHMLKLNPTVQTEGGQAAVFADGMILLFFLLRCVVSDVFPSTHIDLLRNFCWLAALPKRLFVSLLNHSGFSLFVD